MSGQLERKWYDVTNFLHSTCTLGCQLTTPETTVTSDLRVPTLNNWPLLFCHTVITHSYASTRMPHTAVLVINYVHVSPPMSRPCVWNGRVQLCIIQRCLFFPLQVTPICAFGETGLWSTFLCVSVCVCIVQYMLHVALYGSNSARILYAWTNVEISVYARTSHYGITAVRERYEPETRVIK